MECSEDCSIALIMHYEASKLLIVKLFFQIFAQVKAILLALQIIHTFYWLTRTIFSSNSFFMRTTFLLLILLLHTICINLRIDRRMTILVHSLALLENNNNFPILGT